VPREPRLARIVGAVRELDAAPEGRARVLAELGPCLLEAGWFREARSVAAQLAGTDLDLALAIDARALAGLGLVDGLRRLVTQIDFEQGHGAPAAAHESASREPPDRGPGLGAPSGIRDLSDLLAKSAALFARSNEHFGGERDPERLARDLLAAPRMTYGPIAELAHPGPWFSKHDEKEGLGRAGERVPGIAGALARLGRVGLFGVVGGGGGPDGTILPLIGAEERSGEHLGVRWHGTVVWCEGADLKSRAGRQGAQISAAALHEGYWVDVDSVRGERGTWSALRREFSGPGARERVDRVLAVRGLEVEAPLDSVTGREERTRRGALLGEGQRVRLALLRERARALGPETILGDLGREELVRTTETHEQGHLCDRTRFLPVSRKLPQLFRLLLECDFSPRKIGEELEYRAQLVCVADSEEPRIPLAQVLDAAEAGPGGVTPHAAGYARLLDDLLGALENRLERSSSAFPSIDRGRTLAHQLHLLSPAEIRDLSREVAEKKNMVR
jgi:hypothetical protein